MCVLKVMFARLNVMGIMFSRSSVIFDLPFCRIWYQPLIIIKTAVVILKFKYEKEKATTTSQTSYRKKGKFVWCDDITWMISKHRFVCTEKKRKGRLLLGYGIWASNTRICYARWPIIVKLQNTLMCISNVQTARLD